MGSWNVHTQDVSDSFPVGQWVSCKVVPGSLPMQADKSAGSRWGLLGEPLRGEGLQGAPGAPEDLNYVEEGRLSGGRGSFIRREEAMKDSLTAKTKGNL